MNDRIRAIINAAGESSQPKSFRDMAADALSGISAQASARALFHELELLRLVMQKPRRAKMRARPGLYARPKVKTADRIRMNLAASAAFFDAANAAAKSAKALKSAT